MSAPFTGDRNLRNTAIRISDLAVTSASIEDYTFSGCSILGPAVLLLGEGIQLVACTWNVPNLDALFWEIPPTRPAVVGVIGVSRTIFSSCSFSAIGIAGPAELRAVLEQGFS